MTLKEVYDRVHAHVAERQDQLTEDLRTLVRVPSVKGEPEPGAPFGRECARALEVTKEIFAAHGIPSRIFPEGGYLIAEIGKGERCFAMVSHSDVVAVDNNWTLCPPFEPLVQDGFMVGRGTGDNKDAIVSSLYAAEALRDLGIPMNSRIWLVVGSAEESTMPDMRNFAKEQPMPDVSLVPDMSYPVGRGEKGILRFWAVSKDKLTAFRDFSGGLAPNVILGKAQVRLGWTPELEKALGALGESFTCEREGDELVLTAWGISRHASRPEGSVSSAKLLAEALSACPLLPAGDRDVLARALDLLQGYYGEGVDAVCEDPDFSHLTCANTLVRLRDGHLALRYDIRYGASIDGGELIARITRRLEAKGFTIDEISRRDGFIVPKDDPILRNLLNCYSQVTGKEDPRPILANGGTYARELKHAFSTAAETNPPDPFHLPVGHGRAHEPDEFISLDGLVDGAAMLAAMLVSLDRM